MQLSLQRRYTLNTKAIVRLFILCGTIGLLMSVAGCSGTVLYHTKWKEATISGADGEIDCEAIGISKMHAYVHKYDDSGPIAEASWNCSENPPPIPKVRSGENYKIVVAAKDHMGKALFLGEQDDVTVLSGNINDVGNIDLVRFATKLKEKTDDNLLTWSSVKHAKYYRVEIAEDLRFVNTVVNRVMPATNYAPGLESSRVYYWRVTPINSTGIEGRMSEIWSFRF